MSYDTMLTEGSQDAIKRTDKHGYDFSRGICAHCECFGTIGFNLFPVKTKYGQVYVHDACEIEYLKIIAE